MLLHYLPLLVLLFVLTNCSDSHLARGQDPGRSHLTQAGSPSATPEARPLQHIKDIPVLPGFRRVAVPDTSYGYWLQHLALKQGQKQVYLFDGSPKANQNAHFAIIDIDVGKKDLQQCADAVMRLRAEYLFQAQQFDRIRFNFTSGDPAAWQKYASGYRARIRENRVNWVKQTGPDHSYANFRRYLDLVFTYAGTYSLNKELTPVEDIRTISIGDVFIQGGFPGHAVTVVDVARNEISGEKIFLLAQSYMPAQDIHVLKNPMDPALSPWYSTNISGSLQTPEWTFEVSDLKRF